MRLTMLALLLAAAPAWAAPVSVPSVSTSATVASQSREATALVAFRAQIERVKDAMMGDPLTAQTAAQRALSMAQSMQKNAAISPKDAAISLATAQWLLGEAFIMQNRMSEAEKLIEGAVALVQRHDANSKLHGDLLRSRAALAEAGGDVHGALTDYLSAHRIFQTRGEARSRSIALQDIGALYGEAGDYDRGRKYYQQAFEAYSDDDWLNLTTFNNLAQNYHEERRYAQAEAEFGKALALAQKLDSPLLEARILTNLADARSRLGRNDEALRTLDRAITLVQAGEGEGWQPFVLGVRAMVEARRGRTAEAAALMDRAFAGQDLAATEMPFRELHKAAAEINERLGRADLALAHLKAFARLDSEALRLTASASAQLMAAEFDFANQNLRISQLKQGQLERDITIERQRSQFQAQLFIGLGAALLVIFGLLAYGYLSIRRSRDRERAANVELTATNTALGKALQARTDFLATTSHEIRTPLNGILGMAQVLLADRRLPTEARERVELLRGAGEAMKTLVDDILDVAKMEAGELAVEQEEVDLAHLITTCAGLWQEAAANKGLALEYAVEAVPARILSDGDRLRQILSNLLSNAVKFTRDGSVSLEVRARADGEQPLLVFTVRDTGIGIPADERERIFEAFTQVNNSTTRDFSGTGLGLAISQRLAQALGGRIAVDSVPGEGSCFTLSIPCRAVGDAMAELPDGSLTLAQARVLLVEREVEKHALMRMLLTPETRSIDIAVSVTEALFRMDAAHFDHLIIEGASAGSATQTALDGLRTLVARAEEAGTRTTLLAAPSADLPASQLFTAGAGQVILKPVGAAALIGGLKALYEQAAPDGEDIPAIPVQAAG